MTTVRSETLFARLARPRPEDFHVWVAGFAIFCVVVHLTLRFGPPNTAAAQDYPLYAALLLGGVPLVVGLVATLGRGEFGADALAGLSIITAPLLGEYLAGTIVVLMLSGGQALEAFAVRRA